MTLETCPLCGESTVDASGAANFPMHRRTDCEAETAPPRPDTRNASD